MFGVVRIAELATIFILLHTQTCPCRGHLQTQSISRNKRANVKEDDRPDTNIPLSEYLQNCHRAYLLSSHKVWKMVSPFYGQEDKQYPLGVKCSWQFIGDSHCIPEISCRELHLRKDEDCESEYFSVSDGVGGRKRFCGQVDWDDFLRARSGARDLFVEFVSSDSPSTEKTAGFFCEARCASPSRRADDITRLPVEAKWRKEESRCVCGLYNPDDRILGGVDTKVDEFPWMAAIVKFGTRLPLCGGSLISDRFCLTAAHCLKKLNLKPNQVQVLLHAATLDQGLMRNAADVPLGERGSIRSSGYNSSKVTDDQEGTKRINVGSISCHPLSNLKKYNHDVCLLRLEGRISVSEANAPTPVCLPTVELFNQTFDNQMAIVTGWGFEAENAGGTTRNLQKVEVPVIPREKCLSWMPAGIEESLICAGYENGGKDTCTGDSGGPLTIPQVGKQRLQIGIVSGTVEGCGRAKRPGMYTKLTDVAQWIYYQTNLEGAVWCKSSKE